MTCLMSVMEFPRDEYSADHSALFRRNHCEGSVDKMGILPILAMTSMVVLNYMYPQITVLYVA
jgi:hypothetical protein